MKIIYIIRYLFYSLFFITPLLMSSKTSEMFEFNKMMYIYVTAILVSGLWLVHYILERPKVYRSYPLFIALLLFLATQILSTFFSLDAHTSVFGYYGRWNGGVVSICAYLALFFVFVQTFSFKEVIRLLQISLFSSFIVILWGLPAKFGADLSCAWFTGQFTNTCWTHEFAPAVRMFSTLGQPNWLGSYLAIHFFIGLYFFLRTFPLTEDTQPGFRQLFAPLLRALHILSQPQQSLLMNLAYGGYLVLNVTALSFTKSRSSLLAVAISLGIGVVFFLTTTISKKKKYAVRGLLFVLLMIAAAGITFVSSSFFQDTAPENLLVTSSSEIRKIVWKGAIDLGLRYPVFGTGPETFATAYYFTRPAEHNLTSEWDFIYNKAHNEFLNYLATTGFVGFTAYLLVIGTGICVCIAAYRQKRSPQVLLSFLLSLSYGTILVTNFFGFSTSTTQLFFYGIPGMILMLFEKKEFPTHPLALRKRPPIQKMQLAAVLIVSGSLLWSILQYYQADLLYKQGQEAMAGEDYQEAATLLSHALRKKYEHVYEDKLSSTLAHLAFLTAYEKNPDNPAPELISLSKEFNQHTLIAAPKNIQYLRTRAKNYYFYYQATHDPDDLQKAVMTMRSTTTLAPTDAQSYYMTALFYSLLHTEIKDDDSADQAVDYVTTALNMRPQYIKAQELREELTDREMQK